MRTNIERNTGRQVTKCSFQIEVKDIDLVEKISKRRMVSQSEILRESVLNYIKNWR
jgi:flagellar basal body-associated protein FliL